MIRINMGPKIKLNDSRFIRISCFFLGFLLLYVGNDDTAYDISLRNLQRNHAFESDLSFRRVCWWRVASGDEVEKSGPCKRCTNMASRLWKVKRKLKLSRSKRNDHVGTSYWLIVIIEWFILRLSFTSEIFFAKCISLSFISDHIRSF